MVGMLGKRCDRSNRHQSLVGRRCADAAFYPLPLIRAMSKGIKATADAEAQIESESRSKQYLSSVAAGQAPAEASVPKEIPHCFVKRYNSGAKVRVDFEDAHFKRQYLDEYTGDILQHDLIKEAIIEEFKYFCEKEVWMLEDISKMKEIAGHIFVRSRWVVSNKGDVDEPDMRARLVACEVNKGQKNFDFYQVHHHWRVRNASFRNSLLSKRVRIRVAFFSRCVCRLSTSRRLTSTQSQREQSL